jgi:hypothetical protein
MQPCRQVSFLSDSDLRVSAPNFFQTSLLRRNRSAEVDPIPLACANVLTASQHPSAASAEPSPSVSLGFDDPIVKALNAMKLAEVDWTQLSEEQKKHLIDLFAAVSRTQVFAKLEEVFPGPDQKPTRTKIGEVILPQAQANSKTKKPKASSSAAAAKAAAEP